MVLSLLMLSRFLMVKDYVLTIQYVSCEVCNWGGLICRSEIEIEIGIEIGIEIEIEIEIFL